MTEMCRVEYAKVVMQKVPGPLGDPYQPLRGSAKLSSVFQVARVPLPDLRRTSTPNYWPDHTVTRFGFLTSYTSLEEKYMIH